MSLEKWVEYGWLRQEPTSPNEIKSLLGIVDRSLTDSKVEAVSTDLRFIAAFNAALCIATLALRATGHRNDHSSWPSRQNHRVTRIHPESQREDHSKVQDLQQQAEQISL